MATGTDIKDWAQQLVAATPNLDPEQQRIAVSSTDPQTGEQIELTVAMGAVIEDPHGADR